MVVSSSTRLADRLVEARRKHFVGRTVEIDMFRSAVQEPHPPFAVLCLYGPGGVGKTALLHEFARVAVGAGAALVSLDARHINPTPQNFLTAINGSLNGDPSASPFELLAAAGRSVILIDTYELLSPLELWLRETFLPQLSAQTLVVIAGRELPDPAWRSAPEWHDLLRVVSLRNLPPDESRAYLTARGVPAAQHDSVVSFTHGHPLGLSLVADVVAQQASDAVFQPDQAPDVIDALLKQFIQQVPSARHRLALQVCAHTRVTNESLLREVLGEEEAQEIFTWLRGLSFIEQGAGGLYPHDLARDVIDRDLQWRDPDAYADLHRQVRAPIIRRIAALPGPERLSSTTDLVFLHRNNPIMEQAFRFKELGKFYAEPAMRADHEDILDSLARSEGSDVVPLAQHWLQRQPAAWMVVRGSRNAVLGAICCLLLKQITPEDIAIDPVTRAAMSYIQRHAPLRQGEDVMVGRFIFDSRDYQQMTPILNALEIYATSLWITTPSLAWSMIYYASPEPWLTLMNYLNFHRADEADAVAGGWHYGAYAHDWRTQPVLQWLEMMSGREMARQIQLADVRVAPPPPLIVLSEPEFAEAVKSALRNFTHPIELAANPLMRSRLVAQRAEGLSSTPATLQSVLRAAAETLKQTPRDEKFYRAVWHTYFQPAPTQELAAEAIGIPFNTYRYQLTTAVERITAWLWQVELSGE